MREKYRRLCAEDRKVINNMNQAGSTQAEIGRAIGFSQSTISKELSRNSGKRGYRSRQADQIAKKRQREKLTRPGVVIGKIKEQVESRLRRKYSPDQISKSLAKEGVKVSHESIYRHVARDKKEGGALWSELRINGKRRYRRRCKAGRIGKIPNRVDIDLRPAEISKRKRYGDWEADLIQGARGSGYLLSLYERKSRVGKLYKLAEKASEETATAIVLRLLDYEVKSITYDNGLEFAMHGFVNELLGCASYFCHPYSSWEKGGVENYNGLVRQYFPKGMDLRKVSSERLGEVEEEINNRPRNVLGYRSPSEFLDLLRLS
jgi:IS30 family transposase